LPLQQDFLVSPTMHPPPELQSDGWVSMPMVGCQLTLVLIHNRRKIRTLGIGQLLEFHLTLHDGFRERVVLKPNARGCDGCSDLMMRRYNDRLMMLSKVFVHSSFPFKRPQIRFVVKLLNFIVIITVDIILSYNNNSNDDDDDRNIKTHSY